MKIIEKISDMIEEELNDAEKYIECAMKVLEENQSLAETFYKLSTEEMQHMSYLHDQVTRIIEEYRKAKGDPPSDMMAVYNYIHKKHIAKAAEIKNLQMVYKAMPR